jgi:hypothetical protein
LTTKAQYIYTVHRGTEKKRKEEKSKTKVCERPSLILTTPHNTRSLPPFLFNLLQLSLKISKKYALGIADIYNTSSFDRIPYLQTLADHVFLLSIMPKSDYGCSQGECREEASLFHVPVEDRITHGEHDPIGEGVTGDMGD